MIQRMCVEAEAEAEAESLIHNYYNSSTKLKFYTLNSRQNNRENIFNKLLLINT